MPLHITRVGNFLAPLIYIIFKRVNQKVNLINSILDLQNWVCFKKPVLVVFIRALDLDKNVKNPDSVCGGLMSCNSWTRFLSLYIANNLHLKLKF